MLIWASRALVLLNVALGWRLARSCPRYAPLPLALAAALLLNLLREFPLAPVLDATAFLLFPTLSAGLALYVLAPRRLALALLPLALGLTGAPWAAVELIATLLQIGAVATAVLEGQPLWLPERAVLLLVAGDEAALLGPWLGEHVKYWPAGVLQSIVIQALLCYFQVRWLSSSRLGGTGSRSAPPSSAPQLQ